MHTQPERPISEIEVAFNALAAHAESLHDRLGLLGARLSTVRTPTTCAPSAPTGPMNAVGHAPSPLRMRIQSIHEMVNASCERVDEINHTLDL